MASTITVEGQFLTDKNGKLLLKFSSTLTKKSMNRIDDLNFRGFPWFSVVCHDFRGFPWHGQFSFPWFSVVFVVLPNSDFRDYPFTSVVSFSENGRIRVTWHMRGHWVAFITLQEGRKPVSKNGITFCWFMLHSNQVMLKLLRQNRLHQGGNSPWTVLYCPKKNSTGHHQTLEIYPIC